MKRVCINLLEVMAYFQESRAQEAKRRKRA